MTFSLGLFAAYPIAASLMVLLVIIVLTITCYFAGQRLKHKKARLAGVLLMNTVAALMVVGLAFDIQITSKQPSMVYLITHGATNQQLEKIDSPQAVFVMRGAAKSVTNSRIFDVATQIDVPSQILSHQDTIDNLFVLGDGLNSSQWQNLQLVMGETFNNVSVKFSASQPRLGLVDMSWPRDLAVGQFVEIKGQLQGSDEPLETKVIYQLHLLDPTGKIIQTTRIKPFERFALSFPAKSIGQWTYRLQLNKNNDSEVLTDEPIAFSVTNPAKLKILIKQSSPSFETRQLKNWAAEFGNQISVLTQISQDKDIRQNINLSATDLAQITSPFIGQALDNFDWLVIDGRALLALKKQPMSALQAAVKKGLGVYIIADNDLINAWPVPAMDWLSDIEIKPLDVANYASIPIWPHSQIEQVMPLVKAKITAVKYTPLVQNNAAQTLVSLSHIGLGQVAVSLINSTYGWQTAGLTEQYSHYWQSVTYALARPQQTPYWLNAAPDSLTLVNQAKQRCLLGIGDSGVTMHNANQQPLLLTHDLVQTEQHCLTVWPTRNGWHKLTWSENTELAEPQNAKQWSLDSWFYAYAEQDWSVWQQAQNHQASENIAQHKDTKRFEEGSVKPLDKSWLWGLLVLSMSLLWLERKLF
ncbi:hypothetical protein [uncultured Paraglaciecola sp.]|uniref:hypothetical protein n=1 Tax=uncultured Paraglaciecola sp. TaxID=1765024 RepID=UPI0025E4CB50|nr:hypothetical protein [uncultured Paraglaciecola sp.]